MLPRSFQEKVNLTQQLEYHYRASTSPDFEISGYLGQKIGQSYLRSFCSKIVLVGSVFQA